MPPLMNQEDISIIGGIMAQCKRQRATFGTAESCTGGMVGATVTSTAGISEFFKGGIVSYSNEVKRMLLGVNAETLESHGAVSSECAKQMAEGACRALGCDYAIAVTGIAGPGGGSPTKPVGLVFIAAAKRGRGATAKRNMFRGDRNAVREAAVSAALKMLLEEMTL